MSECITKARDRACRRNIATNLPGVDQRFSARALRDTCKRCTTLSSRLAHWADCPSSNICVDRSTLGGCCGQHEAGYLPFPGRFSASSSSPAPPLLLHILPITLLLLLIIISIIMCHADKHSGSYFAISHRLPVICVCSCLHYANHI